MQRVARMALDLALVIKPASATAWRYGKTEMAPPMTVALLHGPIGRTIEEVCAKSSDAVISILSGLATKAPKPPPPPAPPAAPASAPKEAKKEPPGDKKK